MSHPGTAISKSSPAERASHSQALPISAPQAIAASPLPAPAKAWDARRWTANVTAQLAPRRVKRTTGKIQAASSGSESRQPAAARLTTAQASARPRPDQAAERAREPGPIERSFRRIWMMPRAGRNTAGPSSHSQLRQLCGTATRRESIAQYCSATTEKTMPMARSTAPVRALAPAAPSARARRKATSSFSRPASFVMSAPPLAAEEDVVGDAGEEEDVRDSRDHQRAEVEPARPFAMLFHVPLPRPVQRAPHGEQHERRQQVDGTQPKEWAVRRSAMDEERDQRRRHHQGQEGYSDPPMRERTFAAQEDHPGAADQCGDHGRHMRLDGKRGLQQWI